MYRERPSTVEGAVVWTRSPSPAGCADECRVVPDGCIDLMLLGRDLVIAGPDTGPHLATTEPGSTFTGLRLAPGTGPSVLGVPAHTLRDLRVPLDAVWAPAAVQQLRERIGAAGHEPELALEAVAIERLLRAPRPEPMLAALVRALRAGRPVAAAAAAVGISERQLRRRSLDAFGYGPKMLARILRMRRAVDLSRRGMPFADTAARAGYSDQAHMAREVKELSGVPLTELLR